MTTETMLKELENVLLEVKQADESQSDYDMEWAGDDAFCFLRDHGPALVEAVRDADRLQWLQDTFNQVSPQFPRRPEGCTDALEPTGEWAICIRGTRSAVVANSLREAIDKARAEGGK